MDKLKQWVALTVAGVLAVLAAGWFLLISPKRSEASDVRIQTAAALTSNAGLRTQIAVLKAQAKALPKQQAKLAAVAAKIPDNPALPSLIRALTKVAQSSDVELISVLPNQPVAVVSTTAAVTPTAAKAAGTGTTPTATTSVAPVGPAGSLQSIGVTLNVVGGYYQVEQFMDGLESLSRALKVTSFTVAPGESPLKPAATTTAGAVPVATTTGSLVAAINGTVYMASGRYLASAASLGK